MLPVGENDALFGDDVMQILLDRLFDPFLVSLLVYWPLAVQRPVVMRDGHAWYVRIVVCCHIQNLSYPPTLLRLELRKAAMIRAVIQTSPATGSHHAPPGNIITVSVIKRG